MANEIRRFPTLIYHDEHAHEVAQISGAWNLGDAPPDFDFKDFHQRVWDTIMMQDGIYGARVIGYDREGNIYGVRVPSVEEWQEINPWKQPDKPS